MDDRGHFKTKPISARRRALYHTAISKLNIGNVSSKSNFYKIAKHYYNVDLKGNLLTTRPPDSIDTKKTTNSVRNMTKTSDIALMMKMMMMMMTINNLAREVGLKN